MTLTSTALDAFAPAHVMLTALGEGRTTSRELVEMHLERIERYNSALKAIVVAGPDPRAAADAADSLRKRGEPSPLLGLPATLKESMNVPGLPTTVGAPDFKDFVAADYGAIPRRVLGAGAVLLGKTNVPPMLADWQATNPIYGRTVNPWNAELTPGGSTGGGAAAVAAGLSPLEFGSDIGGSIRVPASFCGIFGHKPSESAVPRSGQFPRPSRPNAGMVLGVQGPLARSADDLELAMRVISGPEDGEDVAWRLELPPPRAENLAGMRIAVMPRLDWLPVSGEILDALETLVTRLARAGARVATAAPETFGDLREHHALYLAMLTAITSISLTQGCRSGWSCTRSARTIGWRTASSFASGTCCWRRSRCVRRFRTSTCPGPNRTVPRISRRSRSTSTGGHTCMVSRSCTRGWPRCAGSRRRPFPSGYRGVACRWACRQLVPIWRTTRRSALRRSPRGRWAGSRDRRVTTERM
jgi:amidase